MTMSRYRNYLFDLGSIIKERAFEARRQRDDYATGTEDRQFQSGRLIAFNEMISIMQQQADGFDIPRSELHLDDVEPDQDLV